MALNLNDAALEALILEDLARHAAAVAPILIVGGPRVPLGPIAAAHAPPALQRQNAVLPWGVLPQGQAPMDLAPDVDPDVDPAPMDLG